MKHKTNKKSHRHKQSAVKGHKKSPVKEKRRAKRKSNLSFHPNANAKTLKKIQVMLGR